MRRLVETVPTAVAVVAGFVVLAIVYSWPLALRLGETVPRDTGDPLLSIWTLWWNARSVPLTDAWWQGPIFHPAPGALALSDHRLGLGLITTPLILAGTTPLVAYNVAFLLTFVLSAAAAYGLAWTLTGARLPAVLAGVIFGFHPFRATHLEHLELLAAFWLPAVFWALHTWHRRRSLPAWLGVAGTLTALAYTSGYLFFYGSVAVAAWVLWFERRATARDLGRLALALTVPCLLVAPVLWSYRAIHDGFGLSRPITEIEFFSADLGDLLVSPSLLAIWRLPWDAVHQERALFPGVAALGLVAWTWWRRRRAVATDTTGAPARWRMALLVVGGVALAAAAVAGSGDGVAFSLGPVLVSLRAAYKPLSIAAVALTLVALTSAPVRAAWRAQSPLAFYALATAGLWVLALGPTARVFGERLFYKAPYAWLMVLPGFDHSFRVPARFAMVAAMTSAAAAALALAHWRLRLPAERYRAVGGAVIVLALGDGWIRPLPLLEPPPPLEVPAAVRADDVVLELPTGIFEDAAAMYRATIHGRRLANGLSGYHPPHYVALTAALEDGDVEAVSALPAGDEVVAFVSRDARGAQLHDVLLRMPWARFVAETATHHVVRLRRPVRPVSMAGAAVGLAGVQVSEGDATAGAMLDDDDATVWQTVAQRGTEVVILALERTTAVAGVDLVLGPFSAAYPRELAVDHSTDGRTWTTAWQERPAAAVVARAMRTPASPVVVSRFAATPARFVRLRQIATSTRPWAVARVRVLAPPDD